MAEPRAQDLQIGPDLLRPVARHAAADGEDAQDSCWRMRLGEIVEVEEGIEAEGVQVLLVAEVVVDRQVEAELGVGEGGDVDGNAPLDRALEIARPAPRFASARPRHSQITRRLESTASVRQIAQRVLQQPLHVVEILLELDGVVDAVVAPA